MSAQIIPQNQWNAFFKWYTELHRHWRLTARWQEPRAPQQLLVQNAVLERFWLALSPNSINAENDVDRFWMEFAGDPYLIPRHELIALSEVRFYQELDQDRLELESSSGAVLSLWITALAVEDERLQSQGGLG